MRWPVYNQKVGNLTVMITYLIASMVIVFMINYERPEERAIREYFNLPKNPAWPIYLTYVVLAAGLCVSLRRSGAAYIAGSPKAHPWRVSLALDRHPSSRGSTGKFSNDGTSNE